MNAAMAVRWLFYVARFAIGGLLIYGALHPLADPVVFADAIANYRILPRVLVNLLALVLPWLEILVGVSLLTGVLVDAAATLSAVLFGVFLFAMLSARIRGLDISCGCFLPLGENSTIGLGQILIRTLLLAVSVLLAVTSPKWSWPSRLLLGSNSMFLL